MSKGRVLVAMSGGVDSSVAAYLLKEQGYECIGCTMKLYNNEDAGISRGHTCCSLDDVEDARDVAYRLGMPYHVFNFSDDFKTQIIDKFVRYYENGMTPNPCIDCNKYMKFRKLYERARLMNCDYIATGHYARIDQDEAGMYHLKKAVDPTKDQSYVLYDMDQEQLAHTLFPLGGLTKAQTRIIAQEQGLINADKPDSQDICFVPDGDYARIVEMHSGRPSAPGNFLDQQGQVLGRHKGIIHYTIGQRKGLGISAPEPLYVCRINPDDNTVILGSNEDLFSRDVYARECTFTAGHAPGESFRCAAKIRYRHKEQMATAYLEKGGIHLVFDEPQRAITAGQSLVLYCEEEVIGGGTIRRAEQEN